jgi:hypothetical protein
LFTGGGLLMKCQELDDAVDLVRRLRASRNSRLALDARLRTAQRELEIVQGGGKLDPRRVGRAVKLIAEVLLEEAVRQDTSQVNDKTVR